MLSFRSSHSCWDRKADIYVHSIWNLMDFKANIKKQQHISYTWYNHLGPTNTTDRVSQSVVRLLDIEYNELTIFWFFGCSADFSGFENKWPNRTSLQKNWKKTCYQCQQSFKLLTNQKAWKSHSTNWKLIWSFLYLANQIIK